MSTEPIRFFHRGQIVEVGDAAPTRSVLDWLREDARCVGTKEGCNEGDCGACTVVVGELAEDGDTQSVGGLALRTVNACIRLLPTLDGKALFTVEDLKTIGGGALHPAQQALVDCHGSQCGFCTPGFAMSMFASYEQHRACGDKPTRQQLADELAGNLCRCTGYRPILDAGQRMFDLPAASLQTAPVVAALQQLQRRDTAQLGRGDAKLHAPKSLDALAALRLAKPKATVLSGATDVGLWVTKQFRDLGEIIYVGDVPELKRIEQRHGAQGAELWIGAGASLEAAWRALTARAPALTDAWLRFAAPPVRNAGTMGGNVANGSPIGDSPPVLMALDAAIELRRGERTRRMPLHEFYVDYMKNRMEEGEFVQAVAVPEAAFARQIRAYKISKRFDCDISALLAALAITLDGDGRVEAVRLAFGGMAATVRRAAKAEAALLGKAWDEATLQAAQAALGDDFQPLTDMRASADYRLRAARNLLRRFWLETRREQPLSADQTSVWSVMPHAAATT